MSTPPGAPDRQRTPEPGRPECTPGRSRPRDRGAAPAPRSSSRSCSYNTLLRKLLLELRSEARATEGLAHQLVVRNAGEEVVALARQILSVRPFLPLQLDVRLLLLLVHALQQRGQSVRHRVLRTKGDEDEAVPQLAELREGDRIRIVEPLERARPVEGKAGIREAPVHLVGESLDRPALGCRELAPDEIRDAGVQVAQRAQGRELDAALLLRR